MTERQSARMSKIKNSGLDQYGAGPFEKQQFWKAGVEGVKLLSGSLSHVDKLGPYHSTYRVSRYIRSLGRSLCADICDGQAYSKPQC